MTNTASVTVANHGTFYGSLTDIARLEKWSKRKLAQRIANIREDKYGVSYWLRLPKSVLVVVLADSRPFEV